MLNEASQVLRRVGEYAEGSGYDLEAIIHEWYESVATAQSAEHQKAWDDIGEETPVALTPPQDILNERER